MTKFKIGDIVRAQKTEGGREYYGTTNSKVMCKVTSVGYNKYEDFIWVVVLQRKDIAWVEYMVRKDRFKKEYNRSE